MNRILAEPEIRLQRAASVAMAALEIAGAGGAKSFELLQPVYLRKAEAERKLAAKGSVPLGSKATTGSDTVVG